MRVSVEVARREDAGIRQLMAIAEELALHSPCRNSIGAFLGFLVVHRRVSDRSARSAVAVERFRPRDAQVLQAGVVEEDGDGGAWVGAREQLEGGGEVGAGTEANEEAFLVCEATGAGDRLVVGDSEVAVGLDA